MNEQLEATKFPDSGLAILLLAAIPALIQKILSLHLPHPELIRASLSRVIVHLACSLLKQEIPD